ncbi:hypothetical protein PLEOSDRAFT_1050631 [Pleurotus ostreatus PC15]|uniref:FAD/NAD(P)-binding domain-containing protein n=1 Tax=Pleurotus ostreatus (strain PC15) TaxID=1137138 RepID=A0A067NFL1_PLEO1|nr:hypothetical protein PLEOSDRAFT_1050631 [Pleurotus ostreatus PC15]
MAVPQSTKTVVVLGAAYGGAHAAQVLAQGLPEGWKVVLIDRNSHANHVYILPRLTVLPSHEHKAFIPYRRVFLLDGPHPHLFLQCHVVSLAPHSVKLSKSFPEHGINDGALDFDYLVYALGSVLPGPSDLWGSNVCGVVASPEKCKEELIYQGEKTQGIEWLKKNQKDIEDAPSVLVVGGGALGVQFATDIAAVHPNKTVTLLHSRERLLPRFNEEMHTEILASTVKLGVDVILGERLDLKSVEEVPPKRNEAGQRVVRTVKGRELAADLLMLCTGQRANTEIMGKMDPATVDPGTHLVHVLRTLQVGVLKPEGNKNPEGTVGNTPYPHIFAVGDAADAFGAIQAGHTAYAQAELAGKNILQLIDGKDHELESYKPGPPGIKVSLGLKHSVYQVQGVVGTKDDGVDDLQAAAIWPFFGIKVEKDEDMYE